MKKRGRKPLPEDQKKVRVVIYAKADDVSAAESRARALGLDLSRYTAKVYEKAKEIHRTQKHEVLQT